MITRHLKLISLAFALVATLCVAASAATPGGSATAAAGCAAPHAPRLPDIDAADLEASETGVPTDGKATDVGDSAAPLKSEVALPEAETPATAEANPPALPEGKPLDTNIPLTVAPAAGQPSLAPRPLLLTSAAVQTAQCARTITAKVVAFEQVYYYNRLGAFNPAGTLYALRRDVAPINGAAGLIPGNVRLRADKRPRPLVLRANEGDCLEVEFTNLLHQSPPNSDSPATRDASMHVDGLELIDSISNTGQNVGQNFSTHAAPGETRTYKWHARKQGQFLLYSTAAMNGGEGDGGALVLGLFGSVNVQPTGAKWYRSQVKANDLELATVGRNPAIAGATVGTPKINYEAKYPAGHPRANTPILNILDGTEIVHSDLNALVTGFTEDCTNAPPSSTCGKPFREFTVIFHDETKTVQAFPELNAEMMTGVRDGFAINYGSGGMGAIVFANRKRVGPAKDCGECKLEEFFLESLPNGDPAMIVRKDPATGAAVEALYPDDPSNVHHSYLNDPVRFRNLHAGPKETHVFHLHAHQWLLSPRDQNSTYLDSQTVSPGSGYTYEINYGGTGNRNLGPGDSIFHCHLYPHFAQGMWELWRSHDVFEAGTADRNLPDYEIQGGTPNPAVVPLPNMPMPPMPSEQFKGYPFYVAGKPGHRTPQPPLDMAKHTDGTELNGGLPRHIITEAEFVDGIAAVEPHFLEDPIAARVRAEVNNDANMFIFARKLTAAKVEMIPQDGTPAEKTAMNFHGGLFPGAQAATTAYGLDVRAYPSFTASGAQGLFLVRGGTPRQGAPYADPCPNSPGAVRKYKAAYIQFDMPVNKYGWHDPQARIMVLDQDVNATLNGTRKAEPFFFRANSGDCVEFRATNLIPNNLNLDDFQVFTPTDTLGQHIHLVKVDVTSSDGSGNGYNYEDGTFGASEVRERIEANNHYQQTHNPTSPALLEAKAHPDFGAGPNGDWIGAQSTIQRWWADPLLNRSGQDRTIRTVFTHDHFGPSSHQQHGFYGALVVEPKGSTWQALDGSPLGGRADGGPTSFAANIIPTDTSLAMREFNLAVADFGIVYTADNRPVNPPGKKEADLPKIIEPTDVPQPEAISTADPGAQMFNYRTEPVPLRIGRDNGAGKWVQKSGNAGDMAYVFDSQTHGDPSTPLLRAYENDRIVVRLIQGAQEEQHMFNIHGLKWLKEPSSPNSGYNNAQQLGISEHFEMEIQALPTLAGKQVDYLYSSVSADNFWDGAWGIMRTYQGFDSKLGLAALPNNPTGQLGKKGFSGVCPVGAAPRAYIVNAWAARDLLPGGKLVYNERFGIEDPSAVIFTEQADVAALRAGTKKPEPLVLRANAGDCINVTLYNKLPAVVPEHDSWNGLGMIVPGFNFNDFKTSNRVSLHPQLVSFNPFTSDGAKVGFNQDSTVGPGGSITYVWYAGDRKVASTGALLKAPIEFGSIGLRDMGDVIKRSSHGGVGTLIIEPQGAKWTYPVANSKTTADVQNSAGSFLFREFVVVHQDDLSLTQNGVALKDIGGAEDAEDSGHNGFNYRTEPFWARVNKRPETDLGTMNGVVWTNVMSSLEPLPGCNGPCGDPATPVFTAQAGMDVRFRVLHPMGKTRQHAFGIMGHNWQYHPWTANSTVLGFNPFTFDTGVYGGIGPSRHLNILTNAGGAFRVTGDYLYRSQESFSFAGGMWGIFRVVP